ncbi:MAG: MFS transporter [Pseudomonadales bacterium]|nr:MFS transporter [Pseudomonadales bacterium]
MAFCIDFVAVGFFFYSYGVFFKAIAEDFGGSRLGVAIGLTVTNAVGAIAAPYVGRALDKYPLRNVMGIGALFMAFGFLGLSFVQNELQFYLVLGLFIGFGASSMGNLATSKLVTNWFDKRRGTALGIAAAGVSLSGVIMPYISAELIENFGWRQGFLVYSAFTFLVVVPLIFRLVISRPEDVGLRPDGAMPIKFDDGSILPPVEKAPPKMRLLELFKEHNFRMIVLTFSLLFCSMSATLTHMIPRLTDFGYTLVEASLVMSLCAGFGVVGKLSFGWLSDRLSVRKVMAIVIFMQFTGQYLMFSSLDYLTFAIGASMFGYGVGGVVPMHGAVVGKTFGRDRFGAVLGLMRPAMFPIQILGVPFAGWIFDVTGSYDIAFQVFLGLYFLAALAVSFYRQPAKSVT